jgi:cellulose synthase/poly-beta-1,6-N-acetylglucosamine synthase-like glycosyltransferase
MLTEFEKALVWSYASVVAMLALFGAHRLWVMHLWRRARRRPAGEGAPPPPLVDDVNQQAPSVLVQLPIYNERYVAERIVRAAAALDYPRDRLTIQVLDDSTDDTSQIVDRVAAESRAGGVSIEVVRRRDRSGFKAGALAHGLALSDAELVAIFDADFVPHADWLRRIVREFEDPRVGLVQTRWGHLNADESLLTRAQADFLHGHFVVEHVARAGNGHFFNFNGTAGLWRRAAIDDAGGWSSDTITEDLDLSYRAQLAGWRFRYRPDVVVPAELPADYSAYRQQQRRWTKGAIQVAWKLLPALLTRRGPRLSDRVEAAAHLLSNLSYLLMALLMILMGPLLMLRSRYDLAWVSTLDLATLLLASGSVGLFYTTAQLMEGKSWLVAIARIPLLMAVGIALSLNNARAVVGGLLRRPSPFRRTAKYGEQRAIPRRSAGGAGAGATPDDRESVWWAGLSYHVPGGPQNLLEIAAAAWFTWVFVLGVATASWHSWPILALFCWGLLLAGRWSMLELIAARRRAPVSSQRAIPAPSTARS